MFNKTCFPNQNREQEMSLTTFHAQDEKQKRRFCICLGIMRTNHERLHQTNIIHQKLSLFGPTFEDDSI